MPKDLSTIEILGNKPCLFNGAPSIEQAISYIAGKAGGAVYLV